jgi:hypothetical protein
MQGTNTTKARRGKVSRIAVLSAVCTALLAAAPGAHATTVTLGSPLSSALPPVMFGAERTLSPQALPGATVTSPFNGTIVHWQVIGASRGPLKLQVVHPLAGPFFTGGGTSTPGTITGTGLLSFPANLPIKAGDSIGIVSTAASDTIGDNFTTPGGLYADWVPPLIDGAPPRTPTSGAMGELGFNATVESLPTPPTVAPPTVAPLPVPPTGERAAALKRCKKKRAAKARKSCKKKAKQLPV